jgi:hypothetical protein
MKKFLAVLFFLVPSSAFSACPSEFAIYTNVEGGDVSITLSKQDDPKSTSDIEVAIKGAKVDLRYELTASNGIRDSILSA